MSILIKDFNGTDLIKFAERSYTVGVVIASYDLVILFLGIILETLVIASILRIRSKSVDTLFVLSLCIADLVFNLYMFPSIFIILIADGWAQGRLGCILSSAMILITLAISISSITLITLNRYLAIIWRRNITQFQALVMILLIWVIFPLIGLLYYSNDSLVDYSVALQPSRGYCFPNFSSETPIVILVLILAITFMSIPLLFIIVAYSQIIHFYIKMNRLRDYVTSEVYNSESRLFIKAMAIASAFFLTYCVELAIRVYQISTKSDFDPVLDMIGTMGICSNTLLNSLLLLRFDGLVQSSALDLLGLENWWRNRNSANDEKRRQKEMHKKNSNLIMLVTLGQNNVIPNPHSVTTQKMNN